MSIRNVLKAAIEESGDSAVVLSKKVGISQPTISRLLRGNDVKVSVAETLAKHFGLELKATTPTPKKSPPAKAPRKK